ncbi:MAG: TonB-dependent receptor [Muribaculaceae bacterium]|nr:TonB-dependent receptor [Muribaculaceae bacterium]
MKKAVCAFLSILSCLASYAESLPLDSTVRLDGVTVTAIKQGAELKLQPLAVTIVDAAEIRRWNVSAVKGVSEIAPNFYLPDYGSRMTSSVYVRGLGARLDQPVVGLSVDNVPFLNKDSYDFDLTDIARIEVLRGAQGTLYGRNTMAGQINVYTLSPMLFQGNKVTATMGSGPEAHMSLSHYAKYSDRLAMSFSGNFNFSDGFYKNYYNARKVGTDKSLNLRWRTEWNPSERFSLSNTASFSLSRQSGYPYQLEGSGVINYNDTCFYRRNMLTDGLTLHWQGDGFSVSGITSLQYLDDNMTLDQDFTPLKMFTLTQRRHEWNVTQDVVIRGDKGAYSWLGGLFGFYKRTDMKAPVRFLEEGIARLITDTINNNDRIPISIAWNEPSLLLGDDFKMPVWGLALYHQSSLRLGKWNFALGLRLDYEKTALRYHSYTSTSFNVTVPGRPMPIDMPLEIDESGKLSDDFLELIPKATVSFDLPMESKSDVYLSVGKGYKSGGFNTQMFSEVLRQQMRAKMMENMPSIPGMPSAPAVSDLADVVSYEPEKSWNYEVGAHIACADGRVNTDIALFYMDCRDQQITMFPDESMSGRVTANAARSRSFGAEVQMSYRPTDRWVFNASYGYTNAKFKEFTDGKQNYSGKRVPYAPANTLFASATYVQPLSWQALRAVEATAGVRGVGRIFWDEENVVAQPFYAQMHLSATARLSWISIEAWAENLTGTKFDVFYFESMGNRFLQRGKPRRFGVTLRLNFG